MSEDRALDHSGGVGGDHGGVGAPVAAIKSALLGPVVAMKAQVAIVVQLYRTATGNESVSLRAPELPKAVRSNTCTVAAARMCAWMTKAVRKWAEGTAAVMMMEAYWTQER